MYRLTEACASSTVGRCSGLRRRCADWPPPWCWRRWRQSCDASSSFVKRRLGIASSDKATGLDQIPEALLPLLAVQGTLQLSPLLIACVALAFFVLAIPLARWSHRVGLRDQPH